MNPLIVRLEVDSMKASILHAFAARHDELEQILEEEVDHAIKTFDFESEVRATAHRALGLLVEQAVRDALYAVLYSNPAQSEFEGIAREIIAQLFASPSQEGK